MQERGFLDPSREFLRDITRRGWELFCAQPGNCCLDIVREFYANLLEKKDDTCYVRERWVPCDREAINSIFNLPNIPNCRYTEMLNEGVDYDEVLADLAEPGTVWKERGGHILSFRASGMLQIPKAWFLFISARLLPSGHTSDVTKDRALLCYALKNGKSIDVGSIIASSLTALARRGTTGGMAYPWIICELCRRAGVYIDPTTEAFPPKAALTRETIAALRPHRHRGPPTDEGAAGPSSSTPRRSTDQQGSSLGQRMEALERRQAQFEGYMMDGLRHIHDHQAAHYARTDAWQDSMTSFFDAWSISGHPPTQSQWPMPAVYPPFPEPFQYRAEEEMQSESDPES